MYNLDYQRAIALFEDEARQAAGDPEAWNHLAQAILYRRLYAAGALESEVTGAVGSYLSKPKIDFPKEEEARFLDAIGRSLELAGQRLGKTPGDPAALYAMGVAYAHRAQFEFLVKKAWVAALRDGTRSRGMHARLLALPQQRADALLITGVHEYVAGSLPGYVRPFAALAGFRGDKQRGIAMMEEAVRTSRKTAVESRVLLALVKSREGDPAAAAALMGELAAAFPRNHLYQGEFLLLTASAYEKQSRYADAIAACRRAVDAPGATPVQRSKAWLRAGQIHDLEKRREHALAAYRESLQLAPDGSHLRKQAAAGLSRPYRKSS